MWNFSKNIYEKREKILTNKSKTYRILINDMTKYVENKAETVKIENIYKSVPAQLGNMSNKFQYGKIDSNARKRDYESSLNWLLSSTMVQKSNLLGKVEIPPLRVYYTWPF